MVYRSRRVLSTTTFSLLGVFSAFLSFGLVGPVRGATTVKSASSGNAAVTSTTAKSSTPVKSSSSAKSSTTVKSSSTAKATTPVASTVAAATRGGKLRFGIESETPNGWIGSQSTWTTSSQIVRSTMIESLMQSNLQGDPVCFLCESIRPNSDYTVWTIRLRRGITFHDGTPFDAAAVKANLDESRRPAATTGSTLRQLTGVTVIDPLTVQATVAQRWVSFPANLTQAGGAMVAPSQLRDPQGRARPVGTGAFMFKDWIPNERLTVVRNPNYWRSGLPYLDEITFRPIPDESARMAALRSGELDAIHTQNGQQIVALRDQAKKGQVRLEEYRKFPGVNIITLSNITGATADVRVRRAIELATDRSELNRVAFAGAASLAEAPFGSGDVSVASGVWPKPNLERARALISEVERSTGKPVEITFSAQATPDIIEASQIIVAMWERIGIRVKTVSVESALFTQQTAAGQIQAGFQRIPSSIDPDEVRRFFHSENAAPIGTPGGNYGRIRSGIIDAAFDQIRGNSDPAVRTRAAESITRELAEEANLLILSQTLWVVATSNDFQIDQPQLADGKPLYATPTGAVQLAYAHRRNG